MPIRVLLNGATGRMGQVTSKAIQEDPDLDLVAETGRNDNLAQAIKKTEAQVVIDFTRPEAVYQNALTIIKSGARPVIGTTGLKTLQIEKLQILSKQLKRGGIIAPNFSIGVVLLIKYAQEFAKHFPQVEIIEMHHDKKKDCPSGTAIFTAEAIAKTRKATKSSAVSIHENIKGSRGANYKNIPIHAVRLPGLVAHEQIIFGDIGETITLRHDCIDRQCFMRGVLLACKKVMKLKQLVYGLEEIL
ncbi:MAG TPA: 4-hydroxy-tetrahydrodipicolinate reductase [Gammaproteobacteria bacterium]|nr:4-hydroxy-tetrahydrodipicolinate reductase [Gammaproteobacteria bacterium]